MLSKLCIAAGVIDARQEQSTAQINTLPKAEVCGNHASPWTWILFPAVVYTYKYNMLTSFKGEKKKAQQSCCSLFMLLANGVRAAGAYLPKAITSKWNQALLLFASLLPLPQQKPCIYFFPMAGKTAASNSDGTELINWLAS